MTQDVSCSVCFMCFSCTLQQDVPVKNHNSNWEEVCALVCPHVIQTWTCKQTKYDVIISIVTLG